MRTGPRTFVDRLRDVAAGRFGGRGISFLGDEERQEVRRSYAELERRARAVAARLQDEGLGGERVLVAQPPGAAFVETLFGAFFAGATAVPVYPPDFVRPDSRLRAMELVARDSGARAVLGPREVLTAIARSGMPALSRLQGLDPASAGCEPESWRDPGLGASTLALLQYTSGSESDPKGVCIDHANLLANARGIAQVFGLDESSSGVSWLPPYHDMGLLGGILQPVFLGVPAWLMPPSVFLKQPARWLRAIAESRATCCGGPSFAYELCVRRVPERQRDSLDLSEWRVAFCGAEPVRAATLDAFAEAFAASGFRGEAFLACYGLAEATLLVSGTRPGAGPPRLRLDPGALEIRQAREAREGGVARTLLSCGRAPTGTEIRVVDPKTGASLDEGRVGEVWVKGPAVARGYWGDSDASRLGFEAPLKGVPGTFLRTGDLGFLSNGELYVTGRLKDLLIVRGRNLYPQDVEATVASAHGAVRPGRTVAFSVATGPEERLVAAAEVRRAALDGAAAIAEAIRRRVAEEHGTDPFDVVVLPPGTLPRTQSGKPRRGACRALYLAGRFASAAIDRAHPAS